jgi:fumarate hydratase class II
MAGTTDTAPGYRVEHDTMGEVRVPADALYRAQTQRAIDNFPVSGTRLDAHVIVALARIKRAAARVNADLGVIPTDAATAIVQAADEIVAGAHADQFPIDVYQTGSGTSTNMNMNEVLATLASARLGRDVHPNDVVNASQSSNDVFPSAVHIAAGTALVAETLPALTALRDALRAKAHELAHVLKPGRTHLMDATPVTVGQELGGHAAQLDAAIDRTRQLLPRLGQLPLGGTAVGTGLNTPAGFAERVVALLAAETDLPLTEAPDHFAAQGARDGLVEASASLRGAAVSLTKICNDLRWMASGPNTGLGEIHLPDLQPGSSIMPGKVNPVIPEAVLQVCSRVVGNDAAAAWAGASGAFELNVQIPLMGQTLIESAHLLATSTRLLAERTVAGITADAEHDEQQAGRSPSTVTPLNRLIGYEAAARIAKHAVAHRLTIRQATLDLGFVDRGELTVAQLDQALDLHAMARD